MTAIIRKYAKLWLASALYYTGVLHLLKRIKIKGKTVVLTYHRILSPNEKNSSYSNRGIITSNDTFEWQIRFLNRYFHILDPSEFEALVQSKSTPDGSTCLITFDDGWSDNYKNALPILNKYSVPAVIFLATDYIGSSNNGFWQETLARLIDCLLEKNLPEDPLLEKLGIYKLRSPDTEIQKASILEFISHQKKMLSQETDALTERLKEVISSVDRECLHAISIDHFMDWESVNEMTKRQISFGSHTLSHRRLPFISHDDARFELEQSMSILKNRLGIDVRMIAYPNGDYNESIMEISEVSGYTVGYTTVRGLYDKNTPPLSIPRINIHDGNSHSPAMFMATILGIF